VTAVGYFFLKWISQRWDKVEEEQDEEDLRMKWNKWSAVMRQLGNRLFGADAGAGSIGGKCG